MAEAAGATIESKAKERSPPNAIMACLVDHLNGRTLVNIFEKVKASKEDAFVEKVVHTITLHCRLHNQALTEAVMPLVGKLSKGKELGEALTAKVAEIEGLLAQLDASKKHLDNAQFVELMAKQKQADSELMELAETQLLPAMLEELDMDDLTAAAADMEAAKTNAPLAPQVEAAA